MISIKKRTNQRKNEVTEIIHSPHKFIPLLYGDRFVPRRYSLTNCERNLKFILKQKARDALKLCVNQGYWRENTFVPTINSIMEMTDDRILELMDPAVKSSGLPAEMRYREKTESYYIEQDWLCKPRSKPSASIDTTFDLPDYDSNCDQNLVDWSMKGQIAVSFGHDVIIWVIKEDITMSFDIKCPRSLAYSPNGEFLAIGCTSCKYPVLELWDVSCSRNICVVCGKVFKIKHFAVQCIEWTSTSEQIVCGTYYGSMYIISVPDMNTLKKIRKHHLPITILRFSPTNRYLASGDAEGNIVIYNWNMCSVYLYVRSKKKLNVVFDWHPWTGVDLAIDNGKENDDKAPCQFSLEVFKQFDAKFSEMNAKFSEMTSEDVPASIVLLHVPSKKIVAFYQQTERKIAINYISFSKLTGELLVSTSNQDLGCFFKHLSKADGGVPATSYAMLEAIIVHAIAMLQDVRVRAIL